MHTLAQDLRYGLRMLMKSPGFMAVALLTLALGVGANTAIFTVVNAVLLRPLPYKNPQGLVQVWESNPKRGFPQFSVAPPNFVDWRAQNHVFEQMAAMAGGDYNLTGVGAPERVLAADVSADLFSLLGVEPERGRAFLPGEDQPGSPLVVIVSHGLWERRLGADPNAIGRTLTLDGKPYTLVGIMPAGLKYPSDETELWTPLVFDQRALSGRGAHWVSVIARLKPAVSFEKGQSEMSAIASRLEKQYPDTNAGWEVFLVPLEKQIVGDIQPALLLLMGAVGLVLLIACANVANLLMARGSERQREIAIRAALGAGRGRLLRQLLTESLLLSLLGSALGLLFAGWGTSILLRLNAGVLPRAGEISMDAFVLAFTLGTAVVTTVLFGLLPAFQSSSLDLNAALKEGTRNPSGGRLNLRSLLVVSEVALALLLLIGGGLLMRSFVRLMHVNAGFRPEAVLTVRVQLPEAEYPKKENSEAFYRELLSRIRSLPGVESAGGISFLPLSGGRYSLTFTTEGLPPAPGAEPTSAQYRVATPDYFRTMGISLVRGRVFTEQDRAGAPPVAVINQAMARQFWPNTDPIGQRIFIDDRTQSPREIVGVVGDVRQWLSMSALPEMYVSQLQVGWSSLALVIRSQLVPSSLVAAVSDQVHALNKNLPVYRIAAMEEIVARSVGDRKFSAYLLAIFALLAVVLAAVGIYGVMSHTVALRTREIGIRMALGAEPRDVLAGVLGQGMLLALGGLSIGLAAAFALTHFMASMLFGVTPTDPATFAGVAILLALVALAACYIPARRAMRVDPLVALRYE
jgi:putative ABC transport system permease protein